MDEKIISYYRELPHNTRYNIHASRKLSDAECKIEVDKYLKDNPELVPEAGKDYDIISEL